MALSSLGTLRYGGVNLNGPRVLTKSVTQIPRMDAAGRGRTWTDYTIVLRLMLAGVATGLVSRNSNDGNVTVIRTLLQQPGLPLFYTDKGYGPLVINVAGVKDCIWGPITKELAFESLGAGNACYLDWQVKVAIPCDNGVPKGTAAPFIELLYSVDYGGDAAGYTTRRISVTGRIPSTRFGVSKELYGTADDWREKLAPPLVPGFRRTYPSWSIDEAKTTLRGEIVDEELGVNFLPPGVALGSARQEVTSASQGLALWQSTITAEFELEKNSPIDQFDLTSYFIGTLCKDRIAATAAAIGKNSNAIVPLSLRMSEDEIFNRLKAAFSFTYSFTQPLKDIFGATGLWRPIPGSSWSNWASTMLNGPANPRGYAEMRILPSDDSIVDGCGGRTPGIFTDNGTIPVPEDGPIIVGLPINTDRELRGTKNSFPDPQPENSYLIYESWVWLEVDSGVVPVRVLPKAPANGLNQVLTANPFLAVGSTGTKSNWFDAFLDAIDVMPGIVPLIPPVGIVPPAFKPQQRVQPLVYVFLSGYAMRYGFPVPIPALTKYCGVAPVLSCRLDMGEGYGHGIRRAANEKPIYMAKWNLRYLLPGGMQGWFFPPAPPNPLLDQS